MKGQRCKIGKGRGGEERELEVEEKGKRGGREREEKEMERRRVGNCGLHFFEGKAVQDFLV